MTDEPEPESPPAFTEDGCCVTCGEVIPIRERDRHAAGLDPRRLHCPHQDLAEIVEAERAESRRFRGYVW